MGGCCCSCRKPQFHGTPVYYYVLPPDSEEHESLTSHDGVATVLSSRLLIDLDLNMAIPDTFRAPPTPIPYDVVLGRPQSRGVEPGEAPISCVDLKDGKNQLAYLPLSTKKVGIELLKSEILTTDEDEACSTCLEEYDTENPKIVTKCNHHFHLSCILEWMERSDTCPICDQEMIYQPL